jgi:hypothetical protein
MQAAALDQAMKKPCNAAQPGVEILRQLEFRMSGSIDPMFGFKQGATSDAEQPPRVSLTSSSDAFSDIRHDRSARPNELDANRPLISLAPVRNRVVELIGDLGREFVRENVAMSAACHKNESFRGLGLAPPPATCHVLPAHA